jgi:uncharacterized damage-inducible protein DinB
MLNLLHREFTAAVDGSGAHHQPMKAFAGLSAQDARLRLRRGVPTIWEELAHMVFWQEVLLDCLEQGGALELPKPAESWPKMPPARVAENEWSRIKDEFECGLYRAVSLGQAKDLTAKLHSDFEHTGGGLLLTLAQHNSYHLGQICLLRRVLHLGPPCGSQPGDFGDESDPNLTGMAEAYPPASRKSGSN